MLKEIVSTTANYTKEHGKVIKKCMHPMQNI